ncbi:MAG TPA: hypothetical protein VFQ91_08775, partial [Bryobacteraceae bacterium]|nr:hypothetical protein [Bryobacteraceae bacterium]
QYLMGLRAPEEVPPSFLVQNATTALEAPRVGVGFNGVRRDIDISEIISAEGRRVPDHTVEQRRYRLAMVLIVPPGQSASPQTLAILERYRNALESAFPRYTSNRAVMDASLRRAVRLSIEPAAGMIVGREITASVFLAQPAATPVTIGLLPSNGLVEAPASITIPAGSTSAAAVLKALRSGVEVLRAEPLGNSAYMTAEARLSIAAAPAGLTLRVLSGDRQTAVAGQPLPNPIVLRLTDANDLPYPNVRISANGAVVTPEMAVTDASGQAAFRWTPAAANNLLEFRIEGNSAPSARVIALGKPAFESGAVVNAASFRPGIVPGGIATIFGSNLADAQVSVDGNSAQVFYSGISQINFAVPASVHTAATASVRVETGQGSVSASVPRLAVQPGIFFDTATGRAAAIDRGSRIFELYATGFGAASVTAQAGGQPAEILFSGLAPGFIGLNQVNIRVSSNVPAGDQPVSITADGVTSNEPKLTLAP